MPIWELGAHLKLTNTKDCCRKLSHRAFRTPEFAHKSQAAKLNVPASEFDNQLMSQRHCTPRRISILYSLQFISCCNNLSCSLKITQQLALFCQGQFVEIDIGTEGSQPVQGTWNKQQSNQPNQSNRGPSNAPKTHSEHPWISTNISFCCDKNSKPCCAVQLVSVHRHPRNVVASGAAPHIVCLPNSSSLGNIPWVAALLNAKYPLQPCTLSRYELSPSLILRFLLAHE